MRAVFCRMKKQNVAKNPSASNKLELPLNSKRRMAMGAFRKQKSGPKPASLRSCDYTSAGTFMVTTRSLRSNPEPFPGASPHILQDVPRQFSV